MRRPIKEQYTNPHRMGTRWKTMANLEDDRQYEDYC